MSKLKIINKEELKDWAKEIFQKNYFNMVDVSSKKETFRRALATGKIHVGRDCLLYTSPSPRDATLSRMPSSA